MAATTLLFIALALVVSIQGTLGSTVMKCKDLNVDACAFAVESSGKRCVLEKPLLSIVNTEYTCATSNIVADKLRDWIETEECISACGVDRKALGISSDSLLDSAFVGKLCSHECYRNCPNIVDLYFNLALGEGMYLPQFCEARESNERRGMMEFQSHGESKLRALGPVTQRALAPQISGESKLADAESPDADYGADSPDDWADSPDDDYGADSPDDGAESPDDDVGGCRTPWDCLRPSQFGPVPTPFSV